MVERGGKGGAWLERRRNRWGGTVGRRPRSAALCERVGVPKGREVKLAYQ